VRHSGGFCCGYLILNTTFRRPPELVGSSVRVFGFRGPLGAFLAAWGGIAMLTSAPFDNWWHGAYGLDVKIVSPPHTLLILGVFAIEVGAFFLIAAAMNRADGARFVKLQWMLLYLGGLMLVLGMFFRMEYTWDIRLHRSAAYISVRWACQLIRDVLGMLAQSLGGDLDSRPLHVLSRRTHLDPAVVSRRAETGAGLSSGAPVHSTEVSTAVDRSRVCDGSIASENASLEIVAEIALGRPLFVASLVAVEWPFASFLMTNAAKTVLRRSLRLITVRLRNRTMPCANFSGPSTVLFFGKASRWQCFSRRSAPGLVLRSAGGCERYGDEMGAGLLRRVRMRAAGAGSCRQSGRLCRRLSGSLQAFCCGAAAAGYPGCCGYRSAVERARRGQHHRCSNTADRRRLQAPSRAGHNDEAFERCAVFAGHLWIMETGSWQVRFVVNGGQGRGVLSIPVAATSTGTRQMQSGLGILLAGLGILLVAAWWES